MRTKMVLDLGGSIFLSEFGVERGITDRMVV